MRIEKTSKIYIRGNYLQFIQFNNWKYYKLKYIRYDEDEFEFVVHSPYKMPDIINKFIVSEAVHVCLYFLSFGLFLKEKSEFKFI